MNTKTTVHENKEGKVIVPSKNPEFASVCVKQTRNIVDEQGFMKPRTLHALIVGHPDVLKSQFTHKGQELDGKIIVKESLEPFNKKNPEADFKIAGDTGIPCLKDGQNIYRKHFYTENLSAVDVLIEHTNSAEIKEAYAKVASNIEAK